MEEDGAAEKTRRSIFRKIFETFDKEKKDYLTQQQMWDIIEHLYMDAKINQDGITNIMKDLDPNSTGKIFFEAFYEAVQRKAKLTPNFVTSYVSETMTPVNKIINILKEARKHIGEKKIVKEVEWAMEKIREGKIYETVIQILDLEESEVEEEVVKGLMGWLDEYSYLKENRRASQDLLMHIKLEQKRLSGMKDALKVPLLNIYPPTDMMESPSDDEEDSSFSDEEEKASSEGEEAALGGARADPPSSFHRAGNDAISISDLMVLYRAHFESMREIDTPHCNIFEVCKKLGRPQLLPLTALHVLNSYGLLAIIDEGHLNRFLKEIYGGYRKDNPYHTDIHAADVVQTSHIMSSYANLVTIANLDTLDIFAFVVAGIIHDYKHPGLNNSFHQASMSSLAIRYNDSSILENYHLAQAFKLVKKPKYNIFNQLSIEEFRLMRRRIIRMVLSTDMSKHSMLVQKVESLFDRHREREAVALSNMHVDMMNNTPKIISPIGLIDNSEHNKEFEDKQVILDYALHCADISNGTKPFEISEEWSQRCMEEYWRQGDLEKQMNLPISMLCDRSKVSLPGSQIGFFSMIVRPTFSLLARVMPKMDAQLQQTKVNEDEWRFRKIKDKLRGMQKDEGLDVPPTPISAAEKKRMSLQFGGITYLYGKEDISKSLTPDLDSKTEEI